MILTTLSIKMRYILNKTRGPADLLVETGQGLNAPKAHAGSRTCNKKTTKIMKYLP